MTVGPNPHARTHLHGACGCGSFSFKTKRPPTVRFLCHCLFCQDFTGKPYSDVTVLPASQVVTNGMDQLAFKKYRPPPNLNRGRCKTCGKPAIEMMGFWPLKLMFIPSVNFAEQDLLPPVHMHVFYNRRVQDIADDLPRHEHYWPSQFAIARMLFAKLASALKRRGSR